MDHPYYATDLQTLKQRVSELSSKYPQNFHGMSPPTSPVAPDQFSVQFDDILRRLRSVEDSIQQYRHVSHGNLKVPHTEDAAKTFVDPSAMHTTTHSSSSSTNHATDLVSLFALPDLVAKLSSALSDQQNTSRSLEERLNGLDDRIDDIDPNRFTPASSTAGSYVAEWNSQLYNRNNRPMSMPMLMSFPPPPPPVWELYSGESQNHVLSADPPSNLVPGSELPPSSCRTLNVPANPELTRQYLPPPPPPQPPVPSFECELRAKTYDLGEETRVIKGQIKELADSNHRLHQHLRHVFSELVEQVDEYESRNASVSAGGVDFRDREITRLDEQLTLAQERLKASEESATKKEIIAMDRGQEVKRLQNNLKDQDERAAEQRARLESKLAQAEKQLSAKTLQVQDLQAQVMERDDAINRWEDSWCRMSSESRLWHQKLRETEQYCHLIENGKREENNKLIADHEEQMRQLKDFCEQKDIVIQKQQDNISWAGQLLSQRDAELEHMHRRLRSVEDDHKHSLRTCDRQDRLLRERNQEIGWLKRDVATKPPRIIQGSPVVSRATTPVPTDVDKLSKIGTFDSAGDNGLHVTNHKPPPRAQSPSLDAQPGQGRYNKGWPGSYPFVWDDRVNGFVRQEPPSQGPAPPESPSLGPGRRHGRNGGRSRRSSHRQYPELDRPVPPSWSQPSNPATHDSASGKDRDADLVGFRNAAANTMPSPPLPAPIVARNSTVTFEDSRGKGRERFDDDRHQSSRARRMVSEADLRGSLPNSGAQRRSYNLSKHRSMMDLPQRRLYAYVEDGTESGGEGVSGEAGV